MTASLGLTRYNRRVYLRAGAAWLAVCSLPLNAGTMDAAVPPITLPASDGEPVLAEVSRWRVTYIDFWASWCAPCKLSFPWMNEMHDQWSSQGLRVVAINLDRNQSDVLRFLQQNPARFAVALDPEAILAKRFNIQAMPTSLIIGSNRAMIFTHRGFRLQDRQDLVRRISAALVLKS